MRRSGEGVNRQRRERFICAESALARPEVVRTATARKLKGPSTPRRRRRAPRDRARPPRVPASRSSRALERDLRGDPRGEPARASSRGANGSCRSKRGEKNRQGEKTKHPNGARDGRPEGAADAELDARERAGGTRSGAREGPEDLAGRRAARGRASRVGPGETDAASEALVPLRTGRGGPRGKLRRRRARTGGGASAHEPREARPGKMPRPAVRWRRAERSREAACAGLALEGVARR